jgi:hypothetical protein
MHMKMTPDRKSEGVGGIFSRNPVRAAAGGGLDRLILMMMFRFAHERPPHQLASKS